MVEFCFWVENYEVASFSHAETEVDVVVGNNKGLIKATQLIVELLFC